MLQQSQAYIKAQRSNLGGSPGRFQGEAIFELCLKALQEWVSQGAEGRLNMQMHKCTKQDDVFAKLKVILND